MPISFIMPKFDMDQESATVVEWLKQEGDPVEIDEPVLTVETDKVAIDVPSPGTGKLVRVSVGPGDIVPVTEVIAFILEEGETEEDIPESGPVIEEPGKEEDQKSDPEVQTATVPVQATPVAAKMAADLGVDLSQIPSPTGKITKSDVESFSKQKSIVFSFKESI